MTLKKRLAQLEAQEATEAAPYQCFADLAAYEAARLAGAIPTGLKVFVGVCPNDWDKSDNQTPA